jgi:two-component system osmolarity sensor histidine kinase EnvZ
VKAGNEGYWIGFPLPPRRDAEEWPTRALAWALAIIALLLVAAFAFARYLARPLRQLNVAVDQVGRGETPPPLPESGPSEIAVVNRGFNTMLGNLRRIERDPRAHARRRVARPAHAAGASAARRRDERA